MSNLNLKIINILSDQTKLKRITTEISTHLLYLEAKLKNLLRTPYSMDPKVHKPNIPLRQIISSIGTFNHNTAKIPVPTSPLYTVEYSGTFVNEIDFLKLQQYTTKISFDVEPLSTNFLHEPRDIIVNNVKNTHLNGYGLS